MNGSQQLQGLASLSLALDTSPDPIRSQTISGPRTLEPGAFAREGPSSLVSDGILPSAIRCNGPFCAQMPHCFPPIGSGRCSGRRGGISKLGRCKGAGFTGWPSYENSLFGTLGLLGWTSRDFFALRSSGGGACEP